MIVLLALAWVVVLLPSALKPRFETSPIDGVRNFERSMGILASTRSDRHLPGRWVMMPTEMPANASRRDRVIAKRRRWFFRLLAAAGATFLLGIIPPLRSLWLAHVALDLALAGYVFQLRRWRAAEIQRRSVVRTLPNARGAAAAADVADVVDTADVAEERAASQG